MEKVGGKVHGCARAHALVTCARLQTHRTNRYTQNEAARTDQGDYSDTREEDGQILNHRRGCVLVCLPVLGAVRAKS
eukprot:6196215-Pleurochrysis_carterae.AAC.1